MRVLVTGGTGLVGKAVCLRLVRSGDQVEVLTRDPSRARTLLPAGVEAVEWPEGTGWESSLAAADAVVHLAGETIAQRWTPEVKRRLVKSRVGGLDRIHDALGRLPHRPAVLVSASAVGYYGGHGDEVLTEDDGPGSDFLASVCVPWEEAARRFEGLDVRTARLRVGMVLAKRGGALARMLPVFRIGAGGPVGNGLQWISWIHLDDLADLVAFVIETGRAAGPLNATAPGPVTSREFAASLGSVLHRPALLPAPAPLLRIVLGEMASLLLDGQRVVPKRTLELGFRFRFPDLRTALLDLVT